MGGVTIISATPGYFFENLYVKPSSGDHEILKSNQLMQNLAVLWVTSSSPAVCLMVDCEGLCAEKRPLPQLRIKAASLVGHSKQTQVLKR